MQKLQWLAREALYLALELWSMAVDLAALLWDWLRQRETPARFALAFAAIAVGLLLSGRFLDSALVLTFAALLNQSGRPETPTHVQDGPSA
jgi:hypothetical protein